MEELHRANASALAKLETAQRAAAESMRSAGQALQAVIERRVDAEAFGAADREVSCWMAAAACGVACACANNVSLQARVVALESALPPLSVAAKRLKFTPNSSKAKSAVAGGGCSESQLLADIALEGAVSCSTDAPAKPPGV